MPEVYEYLEAAWIKYAIRLPANQVLQNRIGYLLKRPVGRPPHEVRRYYANFTYQAGSWTKPRRVIAKVEWHPGELYPRVGFIVTNLSRPAERIIAFYNRRGTAQWIKEGKGAIKWTRLSCRTFVANAVRLQLHALAYNLGNFLRTLATPEPIKDLVTVEPEGEADQDRRQGHQPWPQHRLPDGRGRHFPANVPGDFAADRRAAAETAARASMRSAPWSCVREHLPGGPRPDAEKLSHGSLPKCRSKTGWHATSRDRGRRYQEKPLLSTLGLGCIRRMPA
jgi:hypothetical protein